MRLCIEVSSLPWVPYLCHPLRWSQVNFAKFCFDKSHCKCHSHLPSPFKGHLFVNFLRWNFENLFDRSFPDTLWEWFCLEPKQSRQCCFPTLSPGSSAVRQENTRSIYRVILKIMAGGGGTIFSARTQIFSFWPVLDHLDHFLWWMIWTALTLPGSGTSSALGVPEGRPKIQVVCSFLLIFDQFWVLRAKKLRKMTKMFVFQLTLLKKYT